MNEEIREAVKAFEVRIFSPTAKGEYLKKYLKTFLNLARSYLKISDGGIPVRGDIQQAIGKFGFNSREVGEIIGWNACREEMIMRQVKKMFI